MIVEWTIDWWSWVRPGKWREAWCCYEGVKCIKGMCRRHGLQLCKEAGQRKCHTGRNKKRPLTSKELVGIC